MSSFISKQSSSVDVETKKADALCELYEYVVTERGISPDTLTIGHVVALLKEEGILFWRDARFQASQTVALDMLSNNSNDDKTTRHDYETRTKSQEQAAQEIRLDFADFVKFVSPLARMFLRAFSEELVVPDWTSFVADMTYHFYKVQDNKQGSNAQYIPILRDADSEKWGLSVCSIDGQRFSIGDNDVRFSIQSVSKPVTYGLCLKAEGEEQVDQWIDVEPAGRAFNTQDLDADTQRPFNASVNSGAIMAAGLFASRFPESTWQECVDKIRETWRNLSGNGNVGFSQETFDSEKATAYNNFAIAYNLKGRRGLPRDIGIHKMLDVYLGCCSIEMTAEALAVAAATLGNGGVCPITSKEVFPSHVVRHVLAETMTCGMYDQAGKFAVEVGLPAKSGVSGALMVIVPNVFGLATFSPRLNKRGNSVRGLEFCKSLVESYSVHVFEPLRSGNTGAKIDPRVNGSKDEEVGISEFVWAYQAGDVYATALHDMFLFAMVQAACASSGGLSDQMRDAIRDNYELVYHHALDNDSLEQVIRAIMPNPSDMSILEKLKGDRPIPDAFRTIILTALLSIVMADGQVNEKEQAFAIDIISFTGMERCVATMEVDRYKRQIGHCFKDVEPCEVDTETLIRVVDDNVEKVAMDVVTGKKDESGDEVIRLRREIHRLNRKVADLTHLLHKSRQDRTNRLSNKKSFARLSMKLNEDLNLQDK